VKTGTRTPIRLLRNSESRLGLIVVSSSPSNLIDPEVGRSSVPRIWRNVDLPTPEAPTTATMSPGSSDSSTSHSTGSACPLWMYALPSLRISIVRRAGSGALQVVVPWRQPEGYGARPSSGQNLKGRRNLIGVFLTVNAWDRHTVPRVARVVPECARVCFRSRR